MNLSHLYLILSLGIDDPITKTAAGSERKYYQKLAKEMFLILDQPIQVNKDSSRIRAEVLPGAGQGDVPHIGPAHPGR